MGYTYNFRDLTIDATGAELIGDIVAEAVAEAVAQGIAIRDDHGEGAPVGRPDLVWLNGAADEVVEVNGWEVRLDHEEFLLRVAGPRVLQDLPQAL